MSTCLYNIPTCSQYGSDCLFAHGPEELREFTVSESKQEYKTVLCKHWEDDGKCQWGEQCKWAHGKEDLQTASHRPGGGQAMHVHSQHKTVLCSKWTEGACQYGARCMFAHGQAELRSAQQGVVGGRQVITSPQYKTELCQQKQCQFGETCSFAHSQGEMRTVQQNLAEINPNYKGEKSTVILRLVTLSFIRRDLVQVLYVYRRVRVWVHLPVRTREHGAEEHWHGGWDGRKAE